MMITPPLLKIECCFCDQETTINPTHHNRKKQCRHCGETIFMRGIVLGMLIEGELPEPQWSDDLGSP